MRLSTTSVFLFATILVVGGFTLGYWLCARHQAPPAHGGSVAPDTVVVYRHAKPLPVSRPRERVIYRVRTDTVRVEVPVPVAIRDTFYVTGSDPVSVSPWRVTLRRWNPRTGYWQDDRYAVPRKRLRWHVGPTVSYSQMGIALDAEAGLSWDGWGIEAGYTVLPELPLGYWRVGLSYTLTN